MAAAFPSLLAFWVGGAAAPTGFIPPPPVVVPPPIFPVTGGGAPGGYPGLKVSSLVRTWDMPGMRQIIEADDEIVLKVIMEAVTNGRLH
jgi:hypothetical protein